MYWCGTRAGDSLLNSSTLRILSTPWVRNCNVSQQAKTNLMAFEGLRANPLVIDENRYKVPPGPLLYQSFQGIGNSLLTRTV